MMDYKSEGLQYLLSEEGCLLVRIKEANKKITDAINVRDYAEKSLDECRKIIMLRLMEHSVRLEGEGVSRE